MEFRGGKVLARLHAYRQSLLAIECCYPPLSNHERTG
jgi:hypothetical protein